MQNFDFPEKHAWWSSFLVSFTKSQLRLFSWKISKFSEYLLLKTASSEYIQNKGTTKSNISTFRPRYARYLYVWAKRKIRIYTS